MFPSWDSSVKQTRLDMVDWVSDQLMSDKSPLAELADPSLIGRLLQELSVKVSSSTAVPITVNLDRELEEEKDKLDQELRLLTCQCALPSLEETGERGAGEGAPT